MKKVQRKNKEILAGVKKRDQKKLKKKKVDLIG